MDNLVSDEYLHNGNSIIYKELWNKIYMNPINLKHDYAKPVGGFWTVKFYESFSEWMDFLLRRRPEMYYDAKTKDNLLLKLKDTSKILRIMDKNDFKNLKDSNLTVKLDTPIKKANLFDFVIIDELPNYEKLEEIYDAIYVNPMADISLNTFAVSTMLIMNPNAIDYFKTVKLSFEEEYDTPYMSIESIGRPQKIKDVTDNYIKLYELIKKDFISSIDRMSNIDELHNIKSMIEDKYMFDNTIDNLIRHGIKKIDIINSILHNLQVEYKDDIKKLLKK